MAQHGQKAYRTAVWRTVWIPLLFTASVGVLSAEEIGFTGNATGTFTSNGTSALVFTGAEFTTSTSATGKLNLNSLGRISFFGPWINESAADFALRLAFTDLPTLDGTPTLFTADISGKVNGSAKNVNVIFGGPTWLTYEDESGTGSFLLKLNNINNLKIGETETLSGRITKVTFTPTSSTPISSTPEPASIILLATIIAAVGLLHRWRKHRVNVAKP
jgi:hypothetical protein